MTGDYHELVGFEELTDPGELTFDRARLVHRALQHHRDYAVVQLMVKGDDHERPVVECVIADVELDGVPPSNAPGIAYRERLALCVPADAKELVRVFALRKDFPVLLHQDQGDREDAARLCLYFEPETVVLRTWTPQNFLRRIQWWLEKSAKGDLHPADQPVEQLFFETKYELVLPGNFHEVAEDSNQNWMIRAGPSRPDGGFTCFVESVGTAPAYESRTLIYVGLTLPPIVHGFIERDPYTLGALESMLSARGVAFERMLGEALRSKVGETGKRKAEEDSAWVAILLRVPICREQGSPPERVVHKAFLVPQGGMGLGVAMGVLFEHDGCYFDAAGVLSSDKPTEWRSVEIAAMEVLQANNTATAREQSGIQDEGPMGVLVGAGALGSALLNLWGRSGWGAWTVIDGDHVKPHNLSRHVALRRHIGELKVSVVTELHDAVMDGTSVVNSIFGDASESANEGVKKAMSNSGLVVDASAALEYPRYASGNDRLPRHASVFLVPSGDGVLLAEDHQRRFRLRTLEAQYYRAAIDQRWGRRHLKGRGHSFWSGAGCRDVSFVMPYSRILGQASTFAEQLQFVDGCPEPCVRVWERDARLGTARLHDIPVFRERRIGVTQGLDLFLDEGVERRLYDLRAESLPKETGGILLGYHDFNVGTTVVVKALPAPRDSQSDPTWFERGADGLAEAVEEASHRTAGIVGYIGEWHSHPPGHGADASLDDLLQLVYLTLGLADDGLPAIQLIVAEQEMQLLQGAVV